VLVERPEAAGELKAHIESASAAMENLLLRRLIWALEPLDDGPLREEAEIRRILDIGGT
jgi:hypothetical protein